MPPRDPGREAKTDSSPLGSGTLYDKSYMSYKVRFLLAPWYHTLFGAAGRGRETGPPAAPGIRGCIRAIGSAAGLREVAAVGPVGRARRGPLDGVRAAAFPVK